MRAWLFWLSAALLALLVNSCCCFGGFDTDDNDDIDTGFTGPHSEGGGNDV